jgi:hypothetical protein
LIGSFRGALIAATLVILRDAGKAHVSLELYRSVLADKQSQIRNLEERKLVKAGGMPPTNDIAARAAKLEREVSELKAIVAYLERVTVPSGKAP